MKRTLFSRANLYLLSVIIGIILILFVVYTLLTSDNTAADHGWKDYLLLLIWVIFTIVNIFFYKRELKNQEVKK
jgi:small-conductance mechanosensitive channel